VWADPPTAVRFRVRVDSRVNSKHLLMKIAKTKDLELTQLMVNLESTWVQHSKGYSWTPPQDAHAPPSVHVSGCMYLLTNACCCLSSELDQSSSQDREVSVGFYTCEIVLFVWFSSHFWWLKNLLGSGNPQFCYFKAIFQGFFKALTTFCVFSDLEAFCQSSLYILGISFSKRPVKIVNCF
jgi:hypothetical protein